MQRSMLRHGAYRSLTLAPRFEACRSRDRERGSRKALASHRIELRARLASPTKILQKVESIGLAQIHENHSAWLKGLLYPRYCLHRLRAWGVHIAPFPATCQDAD